MPSHLPARRAARAFSLSLFVLAAACTGQTGDDDASDAPATPNDPGKVATVQSEVHLESSFKQFEIVQDGSRASKSTGAIEVPLRDSNGQPAKIFSKFGSWGLPVYLPVRGTCGVTFVSPHYAVTAAHCVTQKNVPDPPNNPLTVRQYDVTNASVLNMKFASVIDGSYPNYEPVTLPMNQVPGYSSTAYSCKVVSRCFTNLVSDSPAYNCDFNGDIAMLYCGDRSSSAQWLPIAPSDPKVGAVDMYWFHELLTPIPLNQPQAGAPSQDFDRFSHYTAFNSFAADKLAEQKKNWHYIGSQTNALLPLKSIPWSGGIQRRRLFNSTMTDLFGCHGTSGSGVLQRNAAGNHELLGPVSTSSSTWTSRLCNHPDTFQPGQSGLAYTDNSVTLNMQSKYSFALRFDRNPIVVNDPPVVGGGLATQP